MEVTGHGIMLLVRIGTENIKLLSAAIHLLQKVSKELIIETEGGILTFRSLNDPKSAFMTVEFGNDFFDQFATGPGSEKFSCKVPIKVRLSQILLVQCNCSAADYVHPYLIGNTNLL